MDHLHKHTRLLYNYQRYGDALRESIALARKDSSATVLRLMAESMEGRMQRIQERRRMWVSAIAELLRTMTIITVAICFMTIGSEAITVA